MGYEMCTAGCPTNASTDGPWLTGSTSGSQETIVARPNSGANMRSAALIVAGQPIRPVHPDAATAARADEATEAGRERAQ
jgi:hypothetical protein